MECALEWARKSYGGTSTRSTINTHTHPKPCAVFVVFLLRAIIFQCEEDYSWQRKKKHLLSSVGWTFHAHMHTKTQRHSGRGLPPWMIGLTAKGHSLLEETISSPTSIERGKFLSPWSGLLAAGCSLFCSALENNSFIFVDEVSQTESSDCFVPIHQLLNGL